MGSFRRSSQAYCYDILVETCSNNLGVVQVLQEILTPQRGGGGGGGGVAGRGSCKGYCRRQSKYLAKFADSRQIVYWLAEQGLASCKAQGGSLILNRCLGKLFQMQNNTFAYEE